MESDTPIQPIVVGDNQSAVRASEVLLSAGFLAAAIRPPTVPAGTARLRFTFTAEHTEAQVDRLLGALADLPLETFGSNGGEDRSMTNEALPSPAGHSG
jgi:8-amino-7-oxononanoate synthase